MKTISTDLESSTDSVGVYSVDYKMDKQTSSNIKKALVVLEKYPILQSVVIDGDVLNSSIIQFDSTIDDNERKILTRDDTFHFRTDIHNIIVYRSGYVYFIGYGKWNGEDFYKFELEV